MTVFNPIFRLSEADINKALSQGFLVIAGVCPEDELTRLRGDYDRLFAEKRGKEKGFYHDLAGTDKEGERPTLPHVLAPDEHIPWVKKSRFVQNCEDIARQVLQKDEPAVFRNSHAILKPARYGSPTPWHQDKAYWGYGSKRQEINFWMPLEDASEESGCLWYIPSAHEIEGQDGFDVLEHQPINKDPLMNGLELSSKGRSAVNFDHAVPAETPAGGVVIHFPHTLHYAGPNKTNLDRKAFIIDCGYPEMPIHEAKEYPWSLQQKNLKVEMERKTTKKNLKN